MLRHLRLLIFDLDYLVFDCAALKVRALRESLQMFADHIPHDVRLPDEVDAEEGFRDHGASWMQFLDIGLDEDQMAQLQDACRVREVRLAAAGIGRIYPGVPEILAKCRHNGASTAIGAEAGREYLLAVSDRCGLDDRFDAAYCTEEFGMGSADEMIEEIMRRFEVNPSETLVLGTRPDYFEAARNNDAMSVACGWGLHAGTAFAEADLQAPDLQSAFKAIEKADALSAQNQA